MNPTTNQPDHNPTNSRRADYLSGVLRAVRCSWLDRRLLAVASAPPQATEATQSL